MALLHFYSQYFPCDLWAKIDKGSQQAEDNAASAAAQPVELTPASAGVLMLVSSLEMDYWIFTGRERSRLMARGCLRPN